MDDAPGAPARDSTREPDGAAFEAAGRRVLAALARYLDESRAGRGPVVPLGPVVAIERELGLEERMRAGGLEGDLDAFLAAYLARTTRLHHPGYFCHQVAVPHPIGALAELVHGLANNPMAVYEMGPAAAACELAALDWMLERVGWPRGRRPGDPPGGPPRAAGVLTHGGSLANLTALLAARAAIAPEAWEEGTPRDLCVLAPRPSHYSIARAVSILGLGARALRPIAVDASEVLRPDGLEPALREARDRGLRVLAVVANACATSTGIYDPLEEVGRFCRERGLWFHVDGAHGASALASPRERHRLRGVELADSLIWDAHKMLRTPTLCTAVLFRDERAFDRAFHEEASYIYYGGEDREGIDLIRRTVECTKAGLGPKLFFSLAAQGDAGVAAYIEGRVDAARRFAGIIRARPGLECPFEVQSNIVCFRHVRPGEEPAAADASQLAIRAALVRGGRFHPSSTAVAGRRYLRLAVMGPGTDDAIIEAMLDEIERVSVGPGD